MEKLESRTSDCVIKSDKVRNNAHGDEERSTMRQPREWWRLGNKTRDSALNRIRETISDMILLEIICSRDDMAGADRGSLKLI